MPTYARAATARPRKPASTSALSHFEVDKKGLAMLLERRGKEFAVLELVQNAWDQEVTSVVITLEPVPGKALARLVVEDDDPAGFADLSHAYTLFAQSTKKANPEARGRFNLGEKLVISLCTTASIASTTGTVVFDDAGRHLYPRRTREQGSRFEGELRLTRAEIAEFERAVRRLIVPAGIRTTYNGEKLRARPVLASFETSLVTERADEDGYLRPTRRKTTVRVYEPSPGEPAALYEMGIPVVETGDRWDVEVAQKVPLNTDRDNVTPAYLRELRARVLDAMHGQLDEDAASENWVAESLEDPNVTAAAVNAVLDRRYGAMRVISDPSDPEANKLAFSQGYAVIHPRSFGRKQWDAIRRTEAALPAGRVTPSPKPYSDDADAPAREELARADWTPGMERLCAFASLLGKRLTGVPPRVVIINARAVTADATYGTGPMGATLEFNVARLGRAWFEQSPASEAVLDLVIHELGHHFSGDHLSEDYYRALTNLGARLARLALDEPELFEFPGA